MPMNNVTPMDYISPYGTFGPQDEDVFLTPDLSTLSIFPPSAVVLCYLYKNVLHGNMTQGVNSSAPANKVLYGSDMFNMPEMAWLGRVRVG